MESPFAERLDREPSASRDANDPRRHIDDAVFVCVVISGRIGAHHEGVDVARGRDPRLPRDRDRGYVAACRPKVHGSRARVERRSA